MTGRFRLPGNRDSFIRSKKRQRPSDVCLRSAAAPDFDEFLILPFKATNAPPYPFEWKDYNETRLDYAAALSRISARYQQRF
jgi:hypothetical protein